MLLSTRMAIFFVIFQFPVINVLARAPANYTDAFARRLAWPLASMSKTNSTLCLDLCFESYEFAGQIIANCDLQPRGPDTCAGSSMVIHDEEAIVLSFRGAINDHQINEANASFGINVPFPGGGNVTKYFYNAFISVWKAGIKDDFLDFRQKYPNYEVWTVGHSLGGIMSTIAAAFISQLDYANSSQIKLVNFAGPRGGDKFWADRISELVPWAYRVVHRWDTVPHVPDDPKLQYVHGGIEIWYNNSMALGDDYKECDAQESPDCSNSVPKEEWTWGDHDDYFEGGDPCAKWCERAKHMIVFN
uniref:Lipase_3 domain-containing protein n=1 Tax=Panagrellus redivivus TaxID=6233 RepID=A0A7E4W2K3_PANRE